MNKLLLLTSVVLLTSLGCFSQNDFPDAHENVIAVALDKVVEINQLKDDEASDFHTIEIRFEGKTIKKFASPEFLGPVVLGTFKDVDSDYIVYRVGLGTGGCVGATLFVIKFSSAGGSEASPPIVQVSPPLTDCLGEFTPWSFRFTKGAQAEFNVLGHTLNLEYMNKWLKISTGRATRKH
jgi:hypothetical protein